MAKPSERTDASGKTPAEWVGAIDQNLCSSAVLIVKIVSSSTKGAHWPTPDAVRLMRLIALKPSVHA